MKLILTTIYVILLAGCNPIKSNKYFHIKGSTMGTTYSIKGCCSTLDHSSIKQEIDSSLEKINNLMSTYRKDSELSKFNKYKAKSWFKISDNTFQVIKTSMEISSKTNGMYDITVGPLVNLWGFGPNNLRNVPSESKLNLTKKRIGYKKIKLNEKSTSIMKTMDLIYLDLSSLAKGFGVDYIAQLFDKMTIKHYLIEIGGEIKTRGMNTKNQQWKIAIQDPDSEENNFSKVIPLSNLAIATSGNYRNYFNENGQNYSHIINPTTGYPITHTTVSVSVIDKNCILADAWATALLTLGYPKGYELALKEKIGAYFIYKKGQFFKKISTPEFIKNKYKP